MSRVDAELAGRLREALSRMAPRHLDELRRLVEIPSVSAQDSGIEEAARAVSGLLAERGLRTELRAAGGNPVVCAWGGADEGPTLLFYEHYDVQPPDPLDEWTCPPFEVTERDGKLYPFVSLVLPAQGGGGSADGERFGDRVRLDGFEEVQAGFLRVSDGITAVGHFHHIDADLARNDVRLTMGGEPTFVSIDDREGAEWNTEAVGPNKRKLGLTLLKKLKEQFAKTGLVHLGQGKWYPGESLPRWALGCYWRKDGQVIWQDDSLFADEAVNYGHTEKQAAWFIHQLAHLLEVKARHILPAYEDAWYYAWRERRLPGNVDPLESRLEDQEERARLASRRTERPRLLGDQQARRRRHRRT